MLSQLELSQKPFIELKISALIEENCINLKQTHKFIDELEERLSSIRLDDVEDLFLSDIKVPIISRPNCSIDIEPKGYKFAIPKKIDVIGGFRVSTAIASANCVDLAVCMPLDCFKDKKDIKNHRYHQKRALYLAHLAQILYKHASDLVSKIEFKYHKGDFLKPVILLEAKNSKLEDNVKFQIFAYPHKNVPFKSFLLHPSHGNVAPRWFFQKYSIQGQSIDDDTKKYLQGDSEDAKSPRYNSSIMSDLELIENSNLMFKQIGTDINITNALVLVKIWLYQRNLHHHFSFVISMFVLYLQTKQTISSNMSAFQIFKVIIRKLMNIDWLSEGLSYFEDSSDKIAEYFKYFPIVFLSPSGSMNLCYDITEDMYLRLKHEAKLADQLLATSNQDSFDTLFLKKVEFSKKFDVMIHLPACTSSLPKNIDYLARYLDHSVSIPYVYSKAILDIARKALTDRIVLLQQNLDHLQLNKSWNFRSIQPRICNETMTFGMLLDAEKSLRIMDIGPSSQDTEAAEQFRQFWDPKSQLRLQNGSINEVVVWHVDNFAKRRSIIEYALKHSMKHLHLTRLVVHYTIFEKFISLQNVCFAWNEDSDQMKSNSISSNRKGGDVNENGTKRRHSDDGTTSLPKPIGIGEEVFQKIMVEYNSLTRAMRQCNTEGYSIFGIQPTSKFLRSTSVFPPLPIAFQLSNKTLKRHKGCATFPPNFNKNQVGKVACIEPIEIIVAVENNDKWPRELNALRAAMLDYIIKLGESLKDLDYCVRIADDFLDIVQGQFVFRVKFKCGKEMILLTHQKQFRKSEYFTRKYEFEVMPRIAAALNKLTHEKPAFAITCRLVKRWLACQLFAGHLSEFTTELIVAHLFVHPEPYTEPASSVCGLTRFFRLVAEFDWHNSPLVVNFDNELKLDQVTKLKESMIEKRSDFPPMVVVTPFDSRDTSSHARKLASLSPDTLNLLCRLCKQAAEFVSREILKDNDRENTEDELKALFRPSFKLFNLIIKLNVKVVQNAFMSIDANKAFKLVANETSQGKQVKVMPIVGLNVVDEYVKRLRTELSQYALFFHDPYGQRIVGVVMRRNSEKKLAGDLDKFKAKLKELGDKLVENITIVKQHQN